MSFGANEMMMDLFRAEVESHSEVLTSSLLKLERDPSDASVYESMMRSAHSIKGAARIVRVEAAVVVSHVMEDCFVAAQRGELQIKSSDFDLLLRSVDLLVRISEATKSAEPQLEQVSGDVHDCVAQLRCLREGRPHAARISPVSPPLIAVAEKIGSALQPAATEAKKSAPSAATSPPAAEARPIEHTAISETSVPVHKTQCLVLECGNSLYQRDADALRHRLLRELKPDFSEVRFDLSRTLDIDAVGLAFLSAARLHVEKNSSARLSFSPVSDEMRVVLRVSGIAQP
ncbi:MAG: Hpt domain-containing protein [Planctomycetaceae bacterium]